MTISAPGVSSNRIFCSGIGGGTSLIPAGDFKYIVRATKPTDDASIILSIDGRNYTQKVSVKNIPNPVAKLGTQYTGGDISSQDFKMQKGFKAVLENFDFDAKCEVVRFDIVRIPKRANAQKVSNLGAEFVRTAATLATAAIPGDIYLFQNIKVKCSGDKVARDIGSMNFTIK